MEIQSETFIDFQATEQLKKLWVSELCSECTSELLCLIVAIVLVIDTLQVHHALVETYLALDFQEINLVGGPFLKHGSWYLLVMLIELIADNWRFWLSTKFALQNIAEIIATQIIQTELTNHQFKLFADILVTGRNSECELLKSDLRKERAECAQAQINQLKIVDVN